MARSSETNKDYGLKISQPFFDAAEADDTNLLFSSSWPSLAVAFETTFTMNAFAFDQEVPHNLGFPPLTIAVMDVNGRSKRPYYLSPNVTKNRLYFNDFDGVDAQVHVRCYNVDLTKSKVYPTLTGTNTNRKYDPDYGIKMAKEGKDINSRDMRDFLIHSRCQTPMLLAVKTEKDTVEFTRTDGAVVTDCLMHRNQRNQLSWVFAYAVLNDDTYGDPVYISAEMSAQAFPSLFFDDGAYTAYIGLAPEKQGALIVLRDPLFSADTLEVTYG